MNKKQVFISYNHNDRDKRFVQMLVGILEYYGFSVWVDYKKVKAGQEMKKAVKQGVKESKYLLFVISEDSVESKWVADELTYAEMVEEDQVIIPIRRDDTAYPEEFRELERVRSVNLYDMVKFKEEMAHFLDSLDLLSDFGLDARDEGLLPLVVPVNVSITDIRLKKRTKILHLSNDLDGQVQLQKRLEEAGFEQAQGLTQESLHYEEKFTSYELVIFNGFDNSSLEDKAMHDFMMEAVNHNPSQLFIYYKDGSYDEQGPYRKRLFFANSDSSLVDRILQHLKANG